MTTPTGSDPTADLERQADQEQQIVELEQAIWDRDVAIADTEQAALDREQDDLDRTDVDKASPGVVGRTQQRIDRSQLTLDTRHDGLDSTQEQRDERQISLDDERLSHTNAVPDHAEASSLIAAELLAPPRRRRNEHARHKPAPTPCSNEPTRQLNACEDHRTWQLTSPEMDLGGQTTRVLAGDHSRGLSPGRRGIA